MSTTNRLFELDPENHRCPYREEGNERFWKCSYCATVDLSSDERHFVPVYFNEVSEKFQWQCEFKWLPHLGYQQLIRQTHCSQKFSDSLDYLGFDFENESFYFQVAITLNKNQYVVYLIVRENDELLPTFQAFDHTGRDTYDDELVARFKKELKEWEIIEESSEDTEEDFLSLINHNLNTQFKPIFPSVTEA